MSKVCESKKENESHRLLENSLITENALSNVSNEYNRQEKVRLVYEDIKKTLGIDFVPNMYKAMASNPDYLELTWRRVQVIMNKEGKLDKKTRDIVAFTVSIMSGSSYCIDVYNKAVLHNGLDEESIDEIYAIIDIYSGLNRFNIANRTKKDDKPWYGCS